MMNTKLTTISIVFILSFFQGWGGDSGFMVQSAHAWDKQTKKKSEKPRGIIIRAYTEEDCVNARKWQVYNEKKSKDPRIISIEHGPTATKHYAIPILQELWNKSLKQAQEECRKK